MLRRRIYAPQAYAPVRNAAVVPIVHSECLTLASWFPLVWQRRQATIQFVAIRALLNDQRAQPPAARALLPLLLHAYPFVFDPRQPLRTDSPKMLDDVFADAPTDIGASITTVHRKLARATTGRFRLLDRFAHESQVTSRDRQRARRARRARALAPEVRYRRKQRRNPGPAGDPSIGIRTADISRACSGCYGVPCARMLGLHRISLYRAGIMLAMAKTFFRDNPNPPEHSRCDSKRRRRTRGGVCPT